ncbi:MAG: hypothetical protein O7G86_08670 [Gammaproteobacteria bacterium]|nr:hypothetical protein [Gammaproteobacteria bacterium]
MKLTQRVNQLCRTLGRGYAVCAALILAVMLPVKASGDEPHAHRHTHEHSHAHPSDMSDKPFASSLTRKLSIGVAVGYERFDTNFKFVDRSSGLSAFIDAEGTLGLPENQSIPILYGYYRAAKRHGIGYSFFRVNRSSTLLAFDENLGDLNVSGRVTLADVSRFYNLTYNFTVYEDDRAFVFASFGLQGIDLKYRFRAEGEVSFAGVSIVGDEFVREVNKFAPLPLVGVDAWFALTPRLSIGSRVALIAGSNKDISGGVLDARIRARFAINKNLALFGGINVFQSDLEIKSDKYKTEVRYGFGGVFLGLDVGF